MGETEFDTGYLHENPDYIEILREIVEHEEEISPMDSAIIEDTPYDCRWDHTEVNAHPSRLYQLEVNGFLERVYDSSNHTDYALKDRDAIKKLLNNLNIDEDTGMRTEIHDFPEDESELDGLFDDVVGYEDVKWLIKRAMTTQEITNILLIGPTGSAKTVFLMCINDLEGANFISGKPTSGPGVLDVLFNETPRYMLIDEMDDMDGGVQEVLSQYTETGILDETKVGKTRKLKTNTKTFGSANEMDDIIDQIQDRFLDLHFEPYTREEYMEVCVHILPRREGVSEGEATEIAKGVWDISDEGDVRKAIQVARLSRGDPQKVISVLENYSPAKARKLL